uniref:ABC transporter permease n=1 Tax=uncultured bacterium 12-5D TaxID=1497524 RepID=A0A059U0Z5_9BACT|nr:ABC transporter permease [uncultured bacterium 12-5D]
MFENLRDSFIHAQAQGHLQVYKKGYLERGSIDPARYFLTAEEFQAIKDIAEADERIHLAAGSMHLSGYLNVGDISAIFVGRAMVPSEQKTIFERAERIHPENQIRDGEALTDDTPFGIAVADGLAESLELKTGDQVILMAPTLDGQMNALDATAQLVFENFDQAVSDKLIALPLPLAQMLYDTEGVAFVVMLLENRADLDAVRADLEVAFEENGLPFITKSWEEMSELYGRTKAMFDIIFSVVFVILSVIVSMSVMNTIGMAVMERTNEIGTLRAMGLRRLGVIKVFAIESALLGIIGCIVGLAVTVGVWYAVEILRPMWVPPMVARQVRWQILLVPEYLIVTFLFLALLTMGAAIFPARRAARAGIVDSLGHT